MTPERWQELKKVLGTALELHPAERSAYLDRACPEPSVRTEVESLIAAHDKGDTRFLDQPSVKLKPGTKLGPYEIVVLAGAGGMGEVYRARDTRLNRIVAIKVLPSYAAGRDSVRERFGREAKAISLLNHPHICTLYDIGHQDGIDYLVMEYVEGETLSARLQKGPLPLDQVLKYAIEIADALDKAHRKGITHRDLKPGNIMLTKSGAKLLDFGLAKLTQNASPSGVPLSQLPTRDPITEQGVILGTVQYMAPEQVEGKEVDARTDIFAFGAVVYEMATGKKAFEGKTQASLIAKILETNPPAMTSLQPMTPPALDRLVKKCLAKEPENRWQSTKDLADELDWIVESAESTSASARTPEAPKRFWQMPAFLAVAAVAVSAVVAAAVLYLRPSPTLPVTRTVIALPPDQQLDGALFPAVALSRDGKQLAYVASRNGAAPQLFLRALDALEARPIPGSDGATQPFFSPDGQWIGFFQVGTLKKASVNGGASVTLTGVGNARGASWNTPGTIVFSPDTSSALQQVSDQGGASQPLFELDKGDSLQRWPDVLPGGKAVLFTGGTATSLSIAVEEIGTRTRKDLVQSASFPKYASSGHLLYVQGTTLMAVPFDLKSLEMRGAAVPVVEGISTVTGAGGAAGGAQYALSSQGTLLYVSGGIEAAQRKLVWVNRNGAEQILPAASGQYDNPRVSPDGHRVALELGRQIWIYDLTRDTLTRFTFDGDSNADPEWTPDGRHISFRSNKDGPLNIYWQLADGSGGLERLTTNQFQQIPKSWSPDGRFLGFHENNPKTKKDLWTLRVSDRKAEPFLRTPFNEAGPTFSPDGRWLAYSSDESGRYEIYVQPFPGPGGKWQISTDGGLEPSWNRNGRVSPDGQRFLMLKETGRAISNTQINIVQNWFEELKQKVPTGKK